MEEIHFIKSGDRSFVAEFQVMKDFNLHIEKNFEGRVSISQKTAGFQYAVTKGLIYSDVIDMDFQGIVYPKQIRVDVVYTGSAEPSEENEVLGGYTEVQ